MKKIITLFALMLCLCATVQQAADTMYIYRNDNVIERIPMAKIDSVAFVAPVAPAIYQYEAVDLGLPSGLKWATCNVGATTPEEYGGYYAWGEIEEKANCAWNTYKWCNGSNTMTKYCTNSSSGTIDNKIVLDPEDDVAHVKWGGNWRMPTSAEQYELLENCTWQWTSVNGVNGYKVAGPNGNSIFLPAAGCRYGSDVIDRGSDGIYWSSSLGSGDGSDAYLLYFNDGHYDWSYNYRYYGQSVRPVSM